MAALSKLLNLLKSLTVSLLLVSPTTLATNNVIFNNYCHYPLYFWAVSTEVVHDEASNYVPAHDTLVHRMVNIGNPGICLKIRDVPMYEHGRQSILQLEYNIDWNDSKWHWDFSAIDCALGVPATEEGYCPFIGGGVHVYTTGDDATCKYAHCLGNHEADCVNTYTRHGSWHGEPSWSCPMGNDLIIDTCTSWTPARTYINGKPFTETDYQPPQPQPPDPAPGSSCDEPCDYFGPVPHSIEELPLCGSC
ncbi:uncharacterized protein BDR25DRAFT_312433 [Lindgomyces ingoldianus]|uniref:Uncharacterized protein n=1 Tax=Lindgomyces ingoldianus TaxID=673940 RepID=A0ACB6R3E4_9PLEO|nr:uncharacterized protein BDR25DRAFT_312433 [Lindgomyces ingoldianus]KAF2473348.1 hypothetical protein BDR25DRAFT_312433 [Lindgomyces ingoldianus]